MGIVNPTFEQINKLVAPATEGEMFLLRYLSENLDDSYLIFYEPFLNGSRPDILILKEDAGAIIIEVKDWNFSHYKINYKNQWVVNTVDRSSVIKGPMSQAFTYKEQLFNLHIPILGLSDIEHPDKYFFGVINCFCFFYCSTKQDIFNLYKYPIDELKEKSDWLNAKFKNKEVLYKDYERNRGYLENKKNQLSRDRNLSFGVDQLKELQIRIEDKLQVNSLFTKQIFDDFYRRLSPPDFIIQQNIPKFFDEKQKKLIKSAAGFSKVKGVAGCGKTTIIAHRVIDAYLRIQQEGRNPNILILTYNITLCNYIKDKLTEAQKGLGDRCTILNYHQFFLQQANKYQVDIGETIASILSNDDLSFLDKQDAIARIFKTDIFKNKEIKWQMDSIFIDEIQDFESEWVKIVRDNFLVLDGEMALFGDQSQNIYQREGIKYRASSIVQGFGRWIELKRSYRFSLDSPLISLFQRFQSLFLVDTENSDLLINSEYQVQDTLNLNKDIIKYYSYHDCSFDTLVKRIFESIKLQIKMNNYHPNDVTILASQTDMLKYLESMFSREEATSVMFETESEDRRLLEVHLGSSDSKGELLKEMRDRILNKNKKNAYHREIESIRRRKKNFFFQNRGNIKLATIHSYKGFESKVVFYILLPDDNSELVYTSLTRCREDLYIYDIAPNKHSQFFDTEIR